MKKSKDLTINEFEKIISIEDEETKLVGKMVVGLDLGKSNNYYQRRIKPQVKPFIKSPLKHIPNKSIEFNWSAYKDELNAIDLGIKLFDDNLSIKRVFKPKSIVPVKPYGIKGLDKSVIKPVYNYIKPIIKSLVKPSIKPFTFKKNIYAMDKFDEIDLKEEAFIKSIVEYYKLNKYKPKSPIKAFKPFKQMKVKESWFKRMDRINTQLEKLNFIAYENVVKHNYMVSINTGYKSIFKRSKPVKAIKIKRLSKRIMFITKMYLAKKVRKVIYITSKWWKHRLNSSLSCNKLPGEGMIVKKHDRYKGPVILRTKKVVRKIARRYPRSMIDIYLPGIGLGSNVYRIIDNLGIKYKSPEPKYKRLRKFIEHIGPIKGRQINPIRMDPYRTRKSYDSFMKRSTKRQKKLENALDKVDNEGNPLVDKPKLIPSKRDLMFGGGLLDQSFIYTHYRITWRNGKRIITYKLASMKPKIHKRSSRYKLYKLV